MTKESTSKVHGHWPVKYAVANIKDRERSVYRLSPQWYMLTPLLLFKLKVPPVFIQATHRNTSEDVSAGDA